MDHCHNSRNGVGFGEGDCFDSLILFSSKKSKKKEQKNVSNFDPIFLHEISVFERIFSYSEDFLHFLKCGLIDFQMVQKADGGNVDISNVLGRLYG